jgi:hypothetical protein
VCSYSGHLRMPLIGVQSGFSAEDSQEFVKALQDDEPAKAAGTDRAPDEKDLTPFASHDTVDSAEPEALAQTSSAKNDSSSDINVVNVSNFQAEAAPTSESEAEESKSQFNAPARVTSSVQHHAPLSSGHGHGEFDSFKPSTPLEGEPKTPLKAESEEDATLGDFSAASTMVNPPTMTPGEERSLDQYQDENSSIDVLSSSDTSRVNPEQDANVIDNFGRHSADAAAEVPQQEASGAEVYLLGMASISQPQNVNQSTQPAAPGPKETADEVFNSEAEAPVAKTTAVSSEGELSVSSQEDLEVVHVVERTQSSDASIEEEQLASLPRDTDLEHDSAEIEDPNITEKAVSSIVDGKEGQSTPESQLLEEVDTALEAFEVAGVHIPETENPTSSTTSASISPQDPSSVVNSAGDSGLTDLEDHYVDDSFAEDMVDQQPLADENSSQALQNSDTLNTDTLDNDIGQIQQQKEELTVDQPTAAEDNEHLSVGEESASTEPHDEETQKATFVLSDPEGNTSTPVDMPEGTEAEMDASTHKAKNVGWESPVAVEVGESEGSIPTPEVLPGHVIATVQAEAVAEILSISAGLKPDLNETDLVEGQAVEVPEETTVIVATPTEIIVTPSETVSLSSDSSDAQTDYIGGQIGNEETSNNTTEQAIQPQLLVEINTTEVLCLL